MNRPPGFLLAPLAFVAIVLDLSLAPFILPTPLPENAPSEKFSAWRAMNHVAVIGQSPHPLGSQRQAAVRGYLLQELSALNLAPETQRVDVSYQGHSGLVENVVVRIPGRRPSGAIVLLAHYDSTQFGPGAGDNATGSAALLEILRALSADPPLRNDVIALFDDGEEEYYLGGQAFVTQHPWVVLPREAAGQPGAVEVRLAIGLDTAARGPVALLSAGTRNGVLIRELALAYPYPLASAFFSTIVSEIAGDTSELQPFLEAGVPGYALEDIFAFPEKHTALDTVDRVRPASLQHMGDQTLALVRRLGNLNLRKVRAPNAVYFTIWGFGLVHYPQRFSAPLAAIALLLFLGTAALGLRQRRLTWKGMALSFLVFLGMLLAVGLLGSLISWAGQTLNDFDHPSMGAAHPRYSLLYLFGSLALTLGLVSWVYSLARRKFSLPDLAFAVLAAWGTLAAGSTLLLPGTSYVFTWPLLAGLLAWLWIFSKHPAEDSWGYWAAISLAAVPGMLLLVPNLTLGYMGSALSILPVLNAFVGLLAGLVFPQVEWFLHD